MYNSSEEELFFSQKVVLKKKFSNRELILHQYFFQKTKVIPKNIIVINNFIFFFVKSKDYFQSHTFLRSIRKDLNNKKVVIIRFEKRLISFLLNFFPDTYIHDIILETSDKTDIRKIKIGLLTFKERGIAIGRHGDYIKAINIIFNNHIIFEKYATFKRYIVPINVKCVMIDF